MGYASRSLSGALCFAAVGLSYGVSEALVSSLCGLPLPVEVWAIVLGIYAGSGFVAGAVVGLLVGSDALPGLLATALGGLALLSFGLAINDRWPGSLLSVPSILGNLLLAGSIVGLAAGLVRWLHARRGPRRAVVVATATVAVSLSSVLAQQEFAEDPKAAAAERTRTVASTTPPEPLPNVLWIVMDTTRADHLSLYGYPRETSPSLRVIASEGVTFESVHSESSWTKPTHFAMVTSRFDAGLQRRLAAEFVTAAEIFADAGYGTGAVLGNLVLGPGSGFTQGFDHVSAGPVRLLYLRLLEKSGGVERLLGLGVLPVVPSLRYLHEKTFLLATAARADDVTDRALAWIRSREGGPFFLFVNYMDPHDPYDPPSPFRERFARDVDPRRGFFKYQPEIGFVNGNQFVRDIAPQMQREDWQELESLYDAEIAFVDHEIGRLVDGVDDASRPRDTIVVVTSDHGELFGEHGLGNHYKDLTEEETRVPLVVRFRSRLPGGLQVRSTVQPHDVLPTVLALAGLPAPAGIHGRNLFDETSTGVTTADAAFALLIRPPSERYPHTASGHLLSARTAEWQLIWSSTGKHRFYDLRRDPQSRENTWAEHPWRAEAMRRLRQWRKETGIEALDGEPDTSTERLRALGYVE